MLIVLSIDAVLIWLIFLKMKLLAWSRTAQVAVAVRPCTDSNRPPPRAAPGRADA